RHRSVGLHDHRAIAAGFPFPAPQAAIRAEPVAASAAGARLITSPIDWCLPTRMAESVSVQMPGVIAVDRQRESPHVAANTVTVRQRSLGRPRVVRSEERRVG